MLRVLTLSTLFPDALRSSFGIFVERQTLALAAREDVEVEIVAPIAMPPWPLRRHPRYSHMAALPRHEIWKGMLVHRPRFTHLPATGSRLRPWLMARALLPKLREIRERFPFDVIDTEFFFPDGPAAMRLAEALDVPFSIKARGSDIHYWGARPQSGVQIDKAAARAGGMVAVSEALKRDMIARGMDGDKITVLYAGIDRHRFKLRDREKAKKALGVSGPLIATVGTLSDLKGQHIVIEALAEIPDATLILAGEGPKRKALTDQVEALNLPGRVRMPGNLSHDDVATLLSAADVMALPSEREGLANAWVEALASGTPVVITDVGGAREIVDRPEAGKIVARDSQAVADAIEAILADPPDREAVRATVAEFSWDRTAQALRDQLQGVVRQASKSSPMVNDRLASSG